MTPNPGSRRSSPSDSGDRHVKGWATELSPTRSSAVERTKANLSRSHLDSGRHREESFLTISRLLGRAIQRECQEGATILPASTHRRSPTRAAQVSCSPCPPHRAGRGRLGLRPAGGRRRHQDHRRRRCPRRCVRHAPGLRRHPLARLRRAQRRRLRLHQLRLGRHAVPAGGHPALPLRVVRQQRRPGVPECRRFHPGRRQVRRPGRLHRDRERRPVPLHLHRHRPDHGLLRCGGSAPAAPPTRWR